jgi:membrane protein required for colicin V production
LEFGIYPTMLIDIIFIILLIIAIAKGLRKGFVVAVFSFVAFFIGLAAALKLSAFVANHLRDDINVSTKWLPFVSFLIVFIVVILLVNWGGKLIEKISEMVFLGWLNVMAGAILYILTYTIILSVVLFYADKIQLFSATTFQASHIWPFIKPLGPKAINEFARVVPVFKGMFKGLEDFFAGLPPKVSS